MSGDFHYVVPGVRMLVGSMFDNDFGGDGARSVGLGRTYVLARGTPLNPSARSEGLG